MPSYRELLQETKASIEEVDARGRAAAARRRGCAAARRRPRARRVGAGPHPRRRARLPRQPRVAHRRRRARPFAPRAALLRGRQPLRFRREDARRARLRAQRSRSPAATRTGSATASPTELPRSLGPERSTRYSRHLLIPEVGEEGQLRLLDSRILLIGAGGLGSPASLYLAAAGVGRLGIVDADVVDETNLQRQIAHSIELARRAEDRLRAPDDRGAEPRRRGRALPRAPDFGERRADPRARLGRDRRRRRQLPDPLPGQRRLGLARHPRRARLDLPLRGPGDRVQARRRPCYRCLFPQPPPPEHGSELRRGRRAGRAAGRDRLDPGRGGAQARARDRRPARRPAAALRRALRRVRRDEAAARSGLPGLRRESPTITEYVDYVEFCAGVGH